MVKVLGKAADNDNCLNSLRATHAQRESAAMAGILIFREFEGLLHGCVLTTDLAANVESASIEVNYSVSFPLRPAFIVRDHTRTAATLKVNHLEGRGDLDQDWPVVLASVFSKQAAELKGQISVKGIEQTAGFLFVYLG